MTNWTLKIHAYLHDPPDKPFALGRRPGHAAWGGELAKNLTGTDAAPSWDTVIRRADHLAAGADRSRVLADQPPALDELRHPLSGQAIPLARFGQIGPEAQDYAREALSEEIERLRSTSTGDEARFIGLWGILPFRLRMREGTNELGALWDWLPADTRMPNHPLVVHQALVSALAAILIDGGEPALLSFSIGPVQGFIEQARRTSDLYASSVMLSRAVLESLGPLVRGLGPDHVIFPALRRSGLFWQWIKTEFRGRVDVPNTLTHGADFAALPNRFLAIVPATRAAEIATACDHALRDWWDAQAVEAAETIEHAHADLRGYAEMAREQARSFVQVAWAVSPWPAVERVESGDEHCRLAAWIHGGSVPRAVATFFEQDQQLRKDGAALRLFVPNGGALYAASYASAEGLLDAVKRARPVGTRVEHGLKCSLCGERGVVPRAISFQEQKAVWRTVRSALAEGRLRPGEALCGVCWTKRWYGRKNISGVPSTSEVAASPFKAAVIRELSSNGALGSSVRELGAAVSDHDAWRDAYVVPSLRRHKSEGGLVEVLARIPGDALLRNPRDDRTADDEVEASSEVMGRIEAAAGSLRRRAGALNLPLPRPYVAVLVLDGDHMGRWLSGERGLALRDHLTASATEWLHAHGAAGYLENRWPMTPALHATFSEACAVFSQRSAPRTMEDEGLLAYLVYAGGDDVLAFTPVGCDPASHLEFATETALRLRLRFSGHVQRGHRGDTADERNPAGFVADPREGLGLAFGNRATASAGLAVFHHRWPLGRALAEARRALEFAKHDLGRDALAISILRRSGQVTRTGLKFMSSEGESPVRVLQRLAMAFAFGSLSPRFVSEVTRRLSPLRGHLPAGVLRELVLPLAREALAGHMGDANGPAPAAFPSLPADIDALFDAAAGPFGVDTAAGSPRDREQLDRWLQLIDAAAFLGRGGDP
jgi:CRISPR-associated protein Cmr2